MTETRDDQPSQAERQCIHCSRCLEVCPLVRSLRREELGPKAKQMLVKQLFEGGELDEREAADLASLCLGCTMCEDVCSQGLSGARSVSRMRAAHPRWRQWLWKQWMTVGQNLWPMARGLARVLPRVSGASSGLRGMRSHGVHPFLSLQDCADPVPDGSYALFGGCTARRLEPAWEMTAAALLDRRGVALAGVSFGCCGATLTHAGLAPEGVQAANANLKVWDEADRPRVVTICASCHAGLAEYVHLDGVDGELAAAFADSLVPLSGLLDGCNWTVGADAPERVIYHHPCHDRNGRDRELLGRALGERFEAGKRGSCCGMGGVMQLDSPDLLASVSHDCWDRMNAIPGDLVLTGCSGCVLNLRATAPRGVVVGHWLDAVSWA